MNSQTRPTKKINAGRLRSMNKFADAMFALLREKPFDSISITDLSEKAGLVRKTFYRNFDSKEQVVEFKFDCVFGELSEKFDFAESDVRSILAYCFEYLLREKAFSTVFIDKGLTDTVGEKIKQYVESAFADTLHSSVSFEPTLADYYSTFIADGFVSVIKTWIAGDYKEPPQKLAELAQRLLSGVIA